MPHMGLSTVDQNQTHTDHVAFFVVVQQAVAITMEQLDMVAQAGVVGQVSRGHPPVDSSQAFGVAAQRMPQRHAQGVGFVNLPAAIEFGTAHKVFHAWVVVGDG